MEYFSLQIQKIEKRETEIVIKSHVFFQSTSSVVEGHFPNWPVIPGVCTLHVVRICLSQALSKPCLVLSKIQRVKFLKPIQHMEGKEYLLKISSSFLDEVIQTEGTIELNSEIYVSFKCSYRSIN